MSTHPHSDWCRRAGQWLRNPGTDSDVVLSTRIRLARNVKGYCFPAQIEGSEREALELQLQQWIQESFAQDFSEESLHYSNLEDLDVISKTVLRERHLISSELLSGDGDRGVTWSGSERISIMTHEEDHLRIQVVSPGHDLQKTLAMAVRIDQSLEKRVPFSFHEQMGYLTACPTNVGTGLRVSVMMHVPALVLMDQMEKVTQSTGKVGLVVRGSGGEGSKATGDLIQISNQQTLGRTEEELLETVSTLAPKIVEWERGVRTHLLKEERWKLEDRFYRSLALLRYARSMGADEALDHLSALRLGIALRLSPEVTLSLADINELFVICQEGHLQAMKGGRLKKAERNQVRALLLRERFKAPSR